MNQSKIIGRALEEEKQCDHVSHIRKANRIIPARKPFKLVITAASGLWRASQQEHTVLISLLNDL